jgi:hypothetical protein
VLQRFFSLASLFTVIMAMSVAEAQSYLPEMSGGAEKPTVETVSGSLFHYVLVQRDMDTIPDGRQVRDDTCSAIAVSIASMQPGTCTVSFSSVAPDGTIRWVVSGRAIPVQRETRVTDLLRFYNNRGSMDWRKDPDIWVGQVVIIKPPAVQPPNPPVPPGGA